MFLREKSIIFAPMEGITDSHYRKVVMKKYPEWDYFFIPFFRVPTVGKIKDQQVIDHIGEELFNDEKTMSKTIFQIMATENSQTLACLEVINDLKIPFLDLNLGCPSKKVNSHGGGARILDDLKVLEKIVSEIRENYEGVFSVKIRAGYKCDKNFKEVLLILEDRGVDFVTVHGRLATQMYSGESKWNYVKMAVNDYSIPIIGNGDIKTIDETGKLFSNYGCHSLMIGREAVRRPWMIKESRDKEIIIDKSFHIKDFFQEIIENYRSSDMLDTGILKRCKALANYFFDYDLSVKRKLLRTSDLSIFLEILASIHTS